MPFPQFLLSNLIWTHDAVVSRRQLLPGTDRNVDLGSMSRSDTHEARFRFQLSVDPLARYNVVDPGTYEFTVEVVPRIAIPH